MMKTTCLSALLALSLVAACGTGPVGPSFGRTTVQNVGSDDLLKLRAGPGLGFKVILGLPDGTRLIRRDCVTELGQRWCRVALADAPAIVGYVSDDYLTGD